MRAFPELRWRSGMEAPRPAPPQRPWAPAGYRVVELADQPTAAPPRPAPPPSVPLGYRAIQVAEETAPTPPRAPSASARPAKGPPSRSPEPTAIWLPLAAGAVLIPGLLIALTAVASPDPAPVRPPAGITVQVDDQ